MTPISRLPEPLNPDGAKTNQMPSYRATILCGFPIHLFEGLAFLLLVSNQSCIILRTLITARKQPPENHVPPGTRSSAIQLDLLEPFPILFPWQDLASPIHGRRPLERRCSCRSVSLASVLSYVYYGILHKELVGHFRSRRTRIHVERKEQ